MAGAAARRRSAAVTGAWQSLFRLLVGVYWLYFAATKWPVDLGLSNHGIDWVHPIMVTVSRVEPIDPVRQLMVQVVLPNWQVFAIAQTVGETLVGALLILGLLTRPAALLGTLLAIGLSLTIAFADTDVGLRWLYYLPILASFEVFVQGPGSVAVDRALPGPQWLRS